VNLKPLDRKLMAEIYYRVFSLVFTNLILVDVWLQLFGFVKQGCFGVLTSDAVVIGEDQFNRFCGWLGVIGKMKA